MTQLTRKRDTASCDAKVSQVVNRTIATQRGSPMGKLDRFPADIPRDDRHQRFAGFHELGVTSRLTSGVTRNVFGQRRFVSGEYRMKPRPEIWKRRWECYRRKRRDLLSDGVGTDESDRYSTGSGFVSRGISMSSSACSSSQAEFDSATASCEMPKSKDSAALTFGDVISHPKRDRCCTVGKLQRCRWSGWTVGRDVTSAPGFMRTPRGMVVWDSDECEYFAQVGLELKQYTKADVSASQVEYGASACYVYAEGMCIGILFGNHCRYL